MISNYNIFKTIAILLSILFFVWLVYDFLKDRKKINNDYVQANNSFLKKKYKKALFLYKKAYLKEPKNLYALEGQARSLMRLKNYKDSEKIFLLVLAKNKNFVPALTNLAILYDTTEKHEMAIYYYTKAIEKNDNIVKGMSWVNRFLKNIHFKPSNIKERLIYLEEQLNLDNTKRKLKSYEIDSMQPDYQM